MGRWLQQIRLFKWKIFFVYTVLVGGAMGALSPDIAFAPIKALVYGMIFGFFMAVFFKRKDDRAKKVAEQISKDQDLVLNVSFLPIYLNVFGSFVFFTLLYLLPSKFSNIEEQLIMPLIGVMTLLLLLYILFFTSQILIGKRLIVVRKTWLGSLLDKKYDLGLKKKVILSWLGKVKVKFGWGKVFSVPYAQQLWFANLPMPEKKPKKGKHEYAYKLINWLNIKSSEANEFDVTTEQKSLNLIPRRYPSVIFILFSAFLGVIFLFIPILLSSNLSIRSIEHSKELKTIRFEKVQNAFWFFDNPARKMFETQWKTACEQNMDHHCRLISYLRILDGDEIDALSQVKMSCSHKDPYSCFNIILNNEATIIDIKLAEFQLEEICKDENHTGQKYCECLGHLSVRKLNKCRRMR